MIRLAMASPRPVPRLFVEKYGRNNFSLSAEEMPCPVSLTTTSNGLPIRIKAARQRQFLFRGILQGFEGIVDEISRTPVQLFRICLDLG